MIKKYQQKLNRQEYMSNNYQKTLKKYYKWQNRKNNKIQNAYHQISNYIVKNYDIIAMEDLNIKGMFKNKRWAPKLQRIVLYKLVKMIKYKSEWYKNIHTNRPILSVQPTMQRMRIPKTRPNTRHTRMDLPSMQNKTQQRPQCRKKYTKKGITRNIKKELYIM